MTQIGTRLLGAFILLLACAAPAVAQWPTVIMFYGGDLKQPVFATGADTPPFSAYVFSTTSNQTGSAKDMGNRAYGGVAFFWGPRDEPAQNGVRVLADLKPEMAWHHGRFYPATGDKPAALFMSSMQVKGKDMKVRDGAPHAGPPPAAIPTDPALFAVGGPVPANAMAVLQRLGVAR